MQEHTLPRLLAPDTLAKLDAIPEILIVHVDSTESYEAGHVPGAVLLEPNQLLRGDPPARGKIPSKETLSALFGSIGMKDTRHVVAYDNEGGGWAGRLIWTLEVLGHKHWSYLDGGLRAWRAANLPLERTRCEPTPTSYRATITGTRYLAEAEDLLAAVKTKTAVIWDARSLEEYSGAVSYARRGGHVPGAVHYEWLRLMDRQRDLRLRPLDELSEELAQAGITKNKPVITHCQSHHRSGLCYLVGRLLGMDIAGYHGSWGEWGNRDDTPVETETV